MKNPFSLFALRWIFIFFIGFLLFVLIQSPDRNIRFVAAVFLVIVLQLREIITFNIEDNKLKTKISKQINL
ncbi:MAG: hypothetical protein N3D10_03350 [Candidatus Micrarchaeota archaeon]|nr:hypothetical protein [Candidatus Micrarchaeota archaeon]